MRIEPHKQQSLPEVTLKPIHRWRAQNLIDTFGYPTDISFPKNVVGGLQRDGKLSITTPSYVLTYTGRLTEYDASQLHILLDLSRNHNQNITRAYSSLNRIKPYLARS